MKKCIVALSMVVMTAAFAAQVERVGSIQIDNIAGLSSAVGKLGAFMGNPMIGMALSGQLSSLPWLQKLGPMSAEPDKAALLSLYMDTEKMLDTPPVVTLLYPLAGTVKDFAAAHPGLKKTTDGAYTIQGIGVVVGSADGKWLAVADNADMARLALKDLNKAQRPLGGDSIRLRLNQKGIAALVKVSWEVRKDLRNEFKSGKGSLPALERQAELSCRQFDRLIKIVEEFEALMIGLKVSDKGLDIGGRFKVREGGELCKVGRQTLSPDAFARIGRDALAADVWAADTGHYVSMSQCAGLCRSYLGLLQTDLGIDCGRFFTCTERENNLRAVVDFPALVAFCREFAEDKNRQKIQELERKFADKKFVETEMVKLQDLMQCLDRPFVAECPAGSAQFAFKGFAPVAAVAERFAATLPEATAKPVYEKSFISLYSIFKAVLPTLLEQLPAQERAALNPIIAQLPPEGKGGIASAVWREKGELRSVVRISADEIKNVAQTVKMGVSYWTMKAMQDAQMKGAGATLPVTPDDDDD